MFWFRKIDLFKLGPQKSWIGVIDRKAMGRLKSEILWIFHTITTLHPLFSLLTDRHSGLWRDLTSFYKGEHSCMCLVCQKLKIIFPGCFASKICSMRKDLALFLVKTVYYLHLQYWRWQQLKMTYGRWRFNQKHYEFSKNTLTQ